MCTYVKRQDIKPFIAEEDITCYKVLKKTEKGEFLSQIWNYQYELNKKCQSVITLDKEKYSMFTLNAIYQGFHSYKSLQNAIRDYILDRQKLVIAKCIIPKGSHYYIAYNDVKETFRVYRSLDEIEDSYIIDIYASDCIIIKEILSEDQISFPYSKGDIITVEMDDNSGSYVTFDMKIQELRPQIGQENISMMLETLDDDNYFSMSLIINTSGNALHKGISMCPKK